MLPHLTGAVANRVMEADISTWLTRIGALTGFAVFVLRVWEFHRDRRPSLRVFFVGSGPDGYYATILNSSKVGTSIYHFSVEAPPKMRFKKLWPMVGARHRQDTDDLVAWSYEPIHIVVPPYDQVDVIFMPLEPDANIWEPPDDLYLRLWTSTRQRPFTFLLVPAGGKE
jgi:hypothetical protein